MNNKAMPAKTPEKIKRKADIKKERELKKRTTDNGGYERRDYIALKKEYMVGQYASLSDFKRLKGIPLTVTAPFVGWVTDRKVYRNQLTKNSIDLKKTSGASIEEIKQKQLNVARFMLEKALAYYESEDFTLKDPEDALKLAKMAMDLERKLSGMESDGGRGGDFTQINIHGKTNLDKELENLDYEGTIKVLAAIRREKSKQAGIVGLTDGEQEIEEGEII